MSGDRFILEMHLRHPRFTYSAYEPFTKNKERIKKITGNSRYIHENELDKACFQHVVAYGGFKDLPRRTASAKVLRDKVFNIAKNPKYDGYERGFASIVSNCFDKRSSSHKGTRKRTISRRITRGNYYKI